MNSKECSKCIEKCPCDNTKCDVSCCDCDCINACVDCNCLSNCKCCVDSCLCNVNENKCCECC